MPRPQVAFALVILFSWLLLHLYRGVVNDAVVYAMQGLIHLHASPFRQDIFFRFGSQDRYTLFGVLYAPLIGVLGLEHAAAALWIGSQVALAAAAWTLARRLMDEREALLAIGLLFVLELSYGAQGVFFVVEDFLTPRLLAEALVLWSIAAALDRRGMKKSAVLLAAALLIHPLMAAAGVGVVVWIRMIAPRARGAAFWVALASAAMIAAVMLSGGALMHARMDLSWLALLAQNTPYLLPSRWATTDWARTAVPLITLWMAIRVLPAGEHRTLAVGALVVALTGLALAVLAETLRITLLIQAQPWRWQWTATVVATLSLPPLAMRLVRAHAAGRAALLLLIATYLLHDLLYCLPIGASAVFLSRRAGSASRSGSSPVSPASPLPSASPALPAGQESTAVRLAVWCALGLVGVALAWDVLMRVYSAGMPFEPVPGAPGIEMARRLMRDSALPALLLSGVWSYTFFSHQRIRCAVVSATACLGCLLLLPVTFAQWTHVGLTAGLYRAFQPWRQRIAPEAEVLWPKNPLDAWVLLDRPSYLSGPQLGAELFSRPAAMVLARRMRALRPFLALEGVSGTRLPAGWSYEPQSLTDLCAASDLRYVVTRQTLAAAPLAVAPAAAGSGFAGLRLYACPAPP